MMKKMDEMKRDLAALERGQQQDMNRPLTSMSRSAPKRTPRNDDKRDTTSQGDEIRTPPRHSVSARDRPTSSNASPAPLRSRVAPQSQSSRSRGDSASRGNPQPHLQRKLASPHPELKAEFTTQEQWDIEASKFGLIIFNKPGLETMELFVLRKYRKYASAHFHYTHICACRSPSGQLSLYVAFQPGYAKDDPLVIWWREEALRFLLDWNKFHKNGGWPLDLCEYYNIWAKEEVRYPGRTSRPPIALRDKPAPPVLPAEDSQHPRQREPATSAINPSAKSDRSRAALLPLSTVLARRLETMKREQAKFANATKSSVPSSSNASEHSVSVHVSSS